MSAALNAVGLLSNALVIPAKYRKISSASEIVISPVPVISPNLRSGSGDTVSSVTAESAVVVTVSLVAVVCGVVVGGEEVVGWVIVNWVVANVGGDVTGRDVVAAAELAVL
jgi:hypothetical protein